MPTWFDCVLAGMTPEAAADAMRCSTGTAAQRMAAARAELLDRSTRSAVTAKDPAAAAVARAIAAFLQSNAPVDFRRRPRLDRAFTS